MGKKPQKNGWPDAKRLCRLNVNDVEMAKALGFRPDALVRAVPNPKQKWKQPVKEWVHELYRERFGHVPGEKTPPASVPIEEEIGPEEIRQIGEQFYWQDYWERNEA
jgi:hypothetical protein